MLKVVLVLIAFAVTACSGGFESESRPYTVGPTKGSFTPVSPDRIPVKIKNGGEVGSKEPVTDKPKEVKSVEDKNKSVNIFTGLNFEINLEATELDGVKQDDAKVNVELQGAMLVYEKNDSGKLKIKKTVSLNLKKSYFRFDKVTGTDKLEEKDFWAFRLVDSKSGVVADIMCLNKWSCKTVITNLYWYEGADLFKKQFHVANTIQPMRVEPVEIEDHKTGDVVADIDIEFDLHTDNHEEETAGESSDYLYLPIRQEDFISDYVEPTAAIDEEEIKIIEDIESQLRPTDAEISDFALPMSKNSHRVDIQNLIFDFNSTTVDVLSSVELPVQALRCQTTKSDAGCAKGGALANADSLEESFLADLESVTSPYVLGKNHAVKAFGTSVLISLVESVSESVNDKYDRKACLGNLSRKNGGRLQKEGGSKSHQNGLDIDYYFYTKDSLNKNNCSFNALTSKDNVFDLERNYYFLTELYKKAQAYDSSGQKFSYLFNIYLDKKLKKQLCEYVKETEGAEAFSPGSISYEVLRRISHENNHDDHFHIRLNCHGTACRDYGRSISDKTGCN